MIKLIPDPTFEQVVRLTVPGKPDPVEVSMIFSHMTVVKAAEWFDAQKDRKVADALAEIVTGWSDVIGDDGRAVEFSAEALCKLLENYPASAREIVLAWHVGLTESRVKN